LSISAPGLSATPMFGLARGFPANNSNRPLNASTAAGDYAIPTVGSMDVV
jgi:hypothetical protein